MQRVHEKISPLEIDQVLLSHPDVLEAAAFGFPHPSLGEEIAVAVVPRALATVAPAQLQAFLRDRLAPFKIPRGILILERIPKGPTGKVQRRQLGRLLGLDAATSRDPQQQISPPESELLELWQKMLNCSSVGLDNDFFERGGDSLLAAQMLFEVEKMIGHGVPEAILFDRSTIRQLAGSVAELDLEATPIIQIQANSNVPFIFFHGDYTGRGLYTRPLARLLGPDQPFISVAPHGIGHEPSPSSFEHMAIERLPQVLAAQPRGPFRLGGYCNGVTVAMEVARLLIGAGHRVELVVMGDSPTVNLRPSMRLLQQDVGKMLFMDGDDWEQARPRLALAVDGVGRLLNNLERISFASLMRHAGMVRRSLRHMASEFFGHVGVRPPVNRVIVKSRITPHLNELRRRNRELSAFYTRLFRHYFPKEIDVPILCCPAGYRAGRCAISASPSSLSAFTAATPAALRPVSKPWPDVCAADWTH